MLCGIIGSQYELKCSRPHPFGQRDQIDVEPACLCPSSGVHGVEIWKKKLEERIQLKTDQFLS